MRLNSMIKTLSMAALAASLSVLSACNSSGDDSMVTLSGSVFAAPVSGSSVVIKDTSGNTLAGPVMTDSNGAFSVEMDEDDVGYNLVFEATGGQFIDEATAASTTAGMLSAYIEGGVTAGGQVHLTPGSTIINQLINQYGKSLANAQTMFESAFGYLSDASIAPTDATAPKAGAVDAERLAGLRAGAFSQLANHLSLTAAEQFQLMNALAQDLSDGSLDGVDASGAVNVSGTAVNLDASIQNKFAYALIAFHQGAGSNSGLTNIQLGNIAEGRIAMSASYKVEYLQVMMAPMEGKSTFRVRISDLAGVPQTGLTVSLMPMMYMESHMHSTPVGSVTDNGDGTYDIEIYYLMASSMMNGDSMGYWQIKVMIGGMMGESVYFYPDVMMAMGDTPKAMLKAQMMGTDKIASMMAGMDMPRPYVLFSEGVTGTTGSHDIALFLAAREDMMSYPDVDTGTVLNAGTAYELTVSSVSVEVSTDGSSWTMATENGNGHYTASSINGLTDGTEGQYYVRLSVNGEQKTTDAAAVSGTGTNDYATFSVTP